MEKRSDYGLKIKLFALMFGLALLVLPNVFCGTTILGFDIPYPDFVLGKCFVKFRYLSCCVCNFSLISGGLKLLGSLNY